MHMSTKHSETIKKLASLDIHQQLAQLQEECAELIVAVSHLRRAKKGDSYNRLLEEVADVEIMIRQCRLILDSDKIDSIINEKLKRADERIKNGSL